MDYTLDLGYSRSSTKLSWKNASNGHVYISGQSGQGKSYFLKRCISQLPQQFVRCIVFDYACDFWDLDASYEHLDMEEQAGIDPFRSLTLSDRHVESPRDVAARIASSVTAAYHIRGAMQPVYLRTAVKKYIDAGEHPFNFRSLLKTLQHDNASAQSMGPTLARLEDLAEIVSAESEEIRWGLDRPGVTVLHFDSLPNRASQNILTEFLLYDLWSESICRSGSGCPIVVVVDECQRFSFADDSIFSMILREGRKYRFSGWFASQWIGNKAAIQALNQAALRANFYPGDEQVSTLSRRLGHGGADKKECERLIRSLQLGEFLYFDQTGHLVVCRIPKRACC